MAMKTYSFKLKKSKRLKKLHELIVAICYSIGSLGFLIGWIMQIMNR